MNSIYGQQVTEEDNYKLLTTEATNKLLTDDTQVSDKYLLNMFVGEHMLFLKPRTVHQT